MLIYLSLLMALAGVLIYVLSANGKVSELGRVMFAAGLLAFLLRLSGTSLEILSK